MTNFADDVAPPSVPGISALVRIDHGGFCQVYRGQSTKTRRGVAVKVLPAPFDRDARSQFNLERTRLGRLRHVPSILQIDEAGELPDGRPYLVSELCGDSAADRLADQRPAAAEVADLGRDLAEALAAAHQLDLVHGSVTPRNVLYRRSGQVVLGDFGTAARQTYLGDLTDVGEYAAPETLRDGTLTTRSDLYGLGASLYAMLTGGPPFPPRVGEHPSERILRVISQPAPRLPESLVTPALATLVAELMAIRPEDRPGDASTVAERLRRLAGQQPRRAADGAATDARVDADAGTHADAGADAGAAAGNPAATPNPPEPAGHTPAPASTDSSTDWSGLLDDVLYDVPPTGDDPRPEPVLDPALAPPPPPGGPANRSRLALLSVAAVLGLAVLVAIPLLVGRLGGNGRTSTTGASVLPTQAPSGGPSGGVSPGPSGGSSAGPSPRRTVTSDGVSPPAAVRLTGTRDRGRTVALSWTGPASLDYAVVVAEPGQTTQVVLAHHARKFLVTVTPGKQYCFLIQATDGQHVLETDPRAIRGAVCHT